MSVKCENPECLMEEKVAAVVDRFGRLAEKLADNQIEMRMSIVKLTENMHELKRVHERVDLIEADLKKLNPLVYKLIGAACVLGVVVPIITTYIIERIVQ